LLKTKTFLVFSNGKLMGVTGRNPDGRYEFELLDTGTAEISLRSPVRACEVCQPDLSDVKIFLRNIQ
jgi:hypothetical protein